MPLNLETILRDSPLSETETLAQLDIIGVSTVSIQKIYDGMEEGKKDFSIETAAVFLTQIIDAKKRINQPTSFDEECLNSLLNSSPTNQNQASC